MSHMFILQLDEVVKLLNTAFFIQKGWFSLVLSSRTKRFLKSEHPVNSVLLEMVFKLSRQSLNLNGIPTAYEANSIVHENKLLKIRKDKLSQACVNFTHRCTCDTLHARTHRCTHDTLHARTQRCTRDTLYAQMNARHIHDAYFYTLTHARVFASTN